jgi:hypothetical protein
MLGVSIMSTMNPIMVPFPPALAEALEREAKAMGMDIASYVRFLEQRNKGTLDPKAEDAIRFMFGTQSDSLRKLAS